MGLATFSYLISFSSHQICTPPKFSKKNLKIGEFSSHYFPRSYEEGKKIKPFIDGLYILKTILINFIIRS